MRLTPTELSTRVSVASAVSGRNTLDTQPSPVLIQTDVQRQATLTHITLTRLGGSRYQSPNVLFVQVALSDEGAGY